MATKDQRTVLAQQLRDAAKLQQDPIAKAVIDLVRLTLDDIKESLVSAEADDMLRLQGAARHLKKLYTELTVVPPSITGANA